MNCFFYTVAVMATALTTFGAYATPDAPHAHSARVAPAATKSGEAPPAPLPPTAVADILENLDAVRIIDEYAGQSAQLGERIATKPGRPLEGAAVIPMELPAEELLARTTQIDGDCIYAGSVVSVGAEAVRLQVDLTGLRDGQEAYIIEPTNGRVHGPYNAGDGMRWLAAVRGEQAVLAVRGPCGSVPQVRLAAFSHVFLSLVDIAKELGCHLDIACETDTVVTDNSSGTAIIMVGGAWFCSGMLVNNEKTDVLEPYFITANHCVCCKEYARDTEVYWDFRSSECGVNDAPLLDNLPRSNGVAMLATDSVLDATLIKLDTVPNGPYGRVYAGWNARRPAVGNGVYALHCPQATHMRISKGKIIAVDNDKGAHQNQIKVRWDEGITEAGSSGGPLFYDDLDLYAGALSQGTTHTCGPIRAGNVDWFAPMFRFYVDSAQYLDSATPSNAEGKDDCYDPSPCPFDSSFGRAAPVTQKFRAFRDDVLEKDARGQALVDYWYSVAPDIARAIDGSPRMKALFTCAASAVAKLLPD